MTIEKRTLGRTGFAVSELGLGTWPLAGAGPSNSYGEMSASQAFSVLDAYVSAGGNLIDTARVYNRAETFIGQYLRQSGNRGRLVISSKTVGGSTAANIDQIVTDVEASLRELGTDYLDLYFLHYPAEEPELIEASLEALLRLKEQGKIRAIGASIRGPNVTEETQALCSAYISTGHVDVIQVIYSILRQQNLRAVEEAAARDVGVIVPDRPREWPADRGVRARSRIRRDRPPGPLRSAEARLRVTSERAAPRPRDRAAVRASGTGRDAVRASRFWDLESDHGCAERRRG